MTWPDLLNPGLVPVAQSRKHTALPAGERSGDFPAILSSANNSANRSGGSRRRNMKKTTLADRQCSPGKKFSIGERPKDNDRPQYMVCYFNEQFEDPVDALNLGNVPVVGLRTGKLELMLVDTEIWLFELV